MRTVYSTPKRIFEYCVFKYRAVRSAACSARAAWADDARLDALVEVPWGKVPGRIALSGYVQEILAYGWDLARATGQAAELDPELATWVLAPTPSSPPGSAASPDHRPGS